MDESKFGAVMGLLVPQVIRLIVEHSGCDELTATKDFYKSEVYAVLEDEETKLWHFSPQALFQMYEEEKKNGVFSIPEEG